MSFYQQSTRAVGRRWSRHRLASANPVALAALNGAKMLALGPVAALAIALGMLGVFAIGRAAGGRL